MARVGPQRHKKKKTQIRQILMAARSKECINGLSLLVIAGSNPTEDMDICLL